MKITQELFDKIKAHSTIQLMECVGVTPDNMSDDTWDITDIVKKAIKCEQRNQQLIVHIGQDNPALFHEQMKIAYVFEKHGGTLLYEKKPEQYVFIAKLVTDSFLDKIRLYWIHNEANDIVPIYDLGDLIVPPILPRYVVTEIAENEFIIEKFNKGQYSAINGKYPTENEAKEIAANLNKEYEMGNASE